MKKSNIKICPSILACDFGYLAEEAKKVENAGADYLHIDIMDGHFVHNLTMGPQIVSAIKRACNLFLDVHLMIYNPFDYIEQFIQAGADMITFHFEATEDVEDTLNYIRRCNVKAGLAFCPETSMSMIPRYLPYSDMVLLMTVHPGFGGQPFMQNMLEKICFTRDVCNKLRIRQGGIIATNEKEKALPPFDIQVDGGITAQTAVECAKNGANIFVAGTYFFENNEIEPKIANMRALCQQAYTDKPDLAILTDEAIQKDEDE